MYSNLEACRGVYTVLQPFLVYVIYTSYKCINVAWHLQVITRVNNVDKCSFILERTLI